MHTLKPLARRAVAVIAASVLAIVGFLLIDTSPGYANLPPGIPNKATALSQLSSLTVASESHSGSYDRDLFPHWIGISGNCNTREWVLKRDGTNVTVNNACQPTSGSWYSNYDNTSTSNSSNIHIDHVVALKEAWESGAWSWSTTQRKNFANDINAPQLWAVSASSNTSKGAKDPAQWMPPHNPVHCNYAKAWVAVKYKWGLSVNSSEKSVLQSKINSC